MLCTDRFIDTCHLPAAVVPRVPVDAPCGDRRAAIRAVERHAILEALRRHRNNRLAAARELGLHKSTLFRKMKSLGIDFPDTDGRSRPA